VQSLTKIFSKSIFTLLKGISLFCCLKISIGFAHWNVEVDI